MPELTIHRDEVSPRSSPRVLALRLPFPTPFLPHPLHDCKLEPTRGELLILKTQTGELTYLKQKAYQIVHKLYTIAAGYQQACG